MAYPNEKTHDEHTTYETPQQERVSIGRYLATRLPTLKPPMTKAPNPVRLLRMLTAQQWLFWLVGFLGWTWVGSNSIAIMVTAGQKA